MGEEAFRRTGAKRVIDWSISCEVIIGAADNGVLGSYHYNRSRLISDPVLSQEALGIFADMQRRGIVSDSAELLYVFIARSAAQFARGFQPPSSDDLRAISVRKAVDLGEVSVRAYLEEYTNEEGSPSARLREKLTGRRIEMWSEDGKTGLLLFMSQIKILSMDFADNHVSEFYSRFGFSDYVVVRGNPSVDTYDSLRFEADPVSYMAGPTWQSDYLEDKLSMSSHEADYLRHAKTAEKQFHKGEYRAAVLSARLAIEAVCLSRKPAKTGGISVSEWNKHAKGLSVDSAFSAHWGARDIAVHRSGEMVDRSDAEISVKSMHEIIEFVLTYDHSGKVVNGQ